MSNYNYDPYGYGYTPPPQRPPSDLDAMMYQNNGSVNPSYPQYPSPLRPSSSFTLHHYSGVAPQPPQPAHLYHSGPLQYPPPLPPQYPPIHAPSYQYDSPSPSCCYQETQPPPTAVQVPDYAPSPTAAVPDYAPPHTFQQFHSFHYESSSNCSGELRFPPPHSDEFLSAYGEYGSALDPHAIHPQSHGLPVPTPDYPQSSSSTSLSTYPLASVLNDMHLSESNLPRPQSTLVSNQSVSFHGHHSHSISSSFSPQTPSSLPTTPLSWQQYGASESQNENNFQVIASQPLQASLQVLLLHGNLDIHVYGARNLPNLDLFSKTINDFVGRRLIDKINGKLESKNMSITSDPYVVVSVSSAAIARTYVISNNENPDWNQHFNVPVAHYAAEIQFTVKDSDMVGSQLIGIVKIPTEQIYGGLKVEGTYSVLGTNGKECKHGATLSLSVEYIPVKELTMYHRGVDSGPEYEGVLGTYFPLRTGCRVKLYQDAHVPKNYLPPLKMDGGIFYEHGQCWRDIYEAIFKARKLIYITGWSVYHMVRLVRDSCDGYSHTLGELLKFKSREGVRVLLLIWDDPTSRSILGYQKDGFMQTHDEETRRFFKHSSVHVLLCPRTAGKRVSWAKKQEAGFIYTHHQKTVIVDSDAENGYRKIIAFVGGLDLCDGRYDNPEHSLFRTLETLHKDDNHNPTFMANVGGPREPWHDLHSRIEGPAAYDVLKNFEERWLKAASVHQGINKLKKSHDDKLLDVKRISEIITMEQSSHLNDPDSWHVQIFRSIDSSSVKGFPKDPIDATSKNLVCGKNVLIDMSIHTAYVKAIRAAQHFIYIENQYFLGSSYNWGEHKDLGANNIIPMEIALKIANKIKANERFSAYIVIPMWPEGDPTGVPTQRILYWQNKTMQMMYEVIYKALVEVGQENIYEPQDYLCFFCLGNREALDENSPSLNPTPANAPNVHARKARRFMIYVHSKGMIVDDEYVIVGSANINQRSLEGTRDTEIAMGAYQPQHTWARKFSTPRGQIYAYRMSLWAEHLGFLDECFTNPASIECMKQVRKCGELNWQQYVAEDVTEMNGHLIKYPVDVDRKGQVKPLQRHPTFPDVGGNICGSFTAVQENLTI